MLADPLSITIGSSPGTTSLPRVSVGESKAKYQSSDGGVIETVSHTNGKRVRSLVRIDRTKVSSDVFLPDTNVSLTAAVYVVVDRPKTGFSSTELKEMMEGLFGQLSASSYATALKILGSES